MLAAGSKLGSCEIISLVGAGGMGEVYRARDSRLGRDVAVKVLPSSFAADADRMARFEQEARAAGALNHPNLLTVHELGQHDGNVYIVSELLDGESLRDRLAAGPLAVKRAIDYALQIANGLAAAHEKGIVHRDLKPENIFVTSDGRVKILDFGLAKLTGAEHSATEAPTAKVQTDPGTVMGTVGYMSPEQVRGQNVDQRSDIFSFGAVLYEMLSGKRAFHGDSRADTMSAVLREDPPDLSQSGRGVPLALDRIVQHCLEKSPAKRFQSARDVAFNLESLAATTSSPGQYAPVRSVSMRPLALSVLALLLVGLGVAAGVLMHRRVTAPTTVTYKPLTYRRGAVQWARFLADGESIVYSATWDGEENKAYITNGSSPVARDLALPGSVTGVSRAGELAIIHDRTLSRVPLGGGAPREVITDVSNADWLPNDQDLAVMRLVNGFWQIEFPIGKPVHRFPYTAGGFRVSPDGKWVAFSSCSAQGGPCNIEVVDQKGTRKTLATGFWAKFKVGLAWHPTREEVWFTASAKASMRDIYAAKVGGLPRIVARYPGNVFLQDISRNGSVLMELMNSHTQAVMVWPAENRRQDVSWFGATIVEDLSRDGTLLLFSETGETEPTGEGAYVRRLDGTASPVRLGDGTGARLSPDGSQAVVFQSGNPTRIVIVPVKAGPTIVMPNPANFVDYQAVEWMPDGKRLVLSASTSDGRRRVYIQDVGGITVTPVTPIGSGFGYPCRCLSPDGESIIATKPFSSDRMLYPLKGGEPRPLPQLGQSVRVIQWLPDGKTVLVSSSGLPPRPVEKYDITTGQRTPWVSVGPADPAGVRTPPRIRASSDLKFYVYSYDRLLSQLVLAQGLQ